MSHKGPRGPYGNAIPFNELFDKGEWVDTAFAERELKFLVIDYGTEADRLAIKGLERLREVNQDVDVTVINAPHLTPELLLPFINDKWNITVNTEYCFYRGPIVEYDCEGNFVRFRGDLSDIPEPSEVVATKVMYQNDLDNILVSDAEGSPTQYLHDLLAKGAYFDFPDEIHVIMSNGDCGPLWALERRIRRMYGILGGAVRVVSYDQTLGSNQSRYNRIVYVAMNTEREFHRRRFAELQGVINRCLNRRDDVHYEDVRAILSAKPTERVVRTPGAFTNEFMSRLKTITISPGDLWDADVRPLGLGFSMRGPRGPITMPGLGERRKKGKNKNKY